MGDLLKRILSKVDWKHHVRKLWRDSVRPELKKSVKDSDSDWDDLALKAVDYLVEKFMGGDEKLVVADMKPAVESKVKDLGIA